MIKIKKLSMNVLVLLLHALLPTIMADYVCYWGEPERALHNQDIHVAGSASISLCLSHVIGTNAAENNNIFNKVFN